MSNKLPVASKPKVGTTRGLKGSKTNLKIPSCILFEQQIWRDSLKYLLSTNKARIALATAKFRSPFTYVTSRSMAVCFKTEQVRQDYTDRQTAVNPFDGFGPKFYTDLHLTTKLRQILSLLVGLF
ncbi:hypothetical protein AVEN_46058-1 [Araneus ventricosus]|uniref:Uncharacterized protein n=1 Tax=Araneus ventricosus TaxID=182803 RepID=A0A4Y2NQE9_ARAVE|nr:hypothetical protein AVEN_46058-1 [Araneus ventricosus]